MKKIFYLLIVGLFFMTSCEDEEKRPIITFDQAGKGGYPKLIEETPRLLDLANLSSAAYNYSVEFVDENGGDNVSLYELFVTYVDNNPGNGDDSKARQLFKSFSPSDFTTSANGLKSISVAVPLSELLAATGVSPDNIRANDAFQMAGVVTLTDGNSFGAGNSSAAVRGSAFAGHFDFSLKATCPLPDAAFTGSYTMTYENPGNLAFGVGPLGPEGTVFNLTTTGPTTRAFDFTYLIEGGFGQGPVPYVLEFICDQVITGPDIGTALGCGGTITISTSPNTYPQDINDDSVIRVGGLEWDDDGGCDVPATEIIFVLTKN